MHRRVCLHLRIYGAFKMTACSADGTFERYTQYWGCISMNIQKLAAQFSGVEPHTLWIVIIIVSLTKSIRKSHIINFKYFIELFITILYFNVRFWVFYCLFYKSVLFSYFLHQYVYCLVWEYILITQTIVDIILMSAFLTSFWCLEIEK